MCRSPHACAWQLCLGLLLPWPGCALAQTAPLVIDDFGVYTLEREQFVPYPGATGDRVTRYEGLRLLYSAHDICAHLGTNFGFHYSDPRGAAAGDRQITALTDHPAMYSDNGRWQSHDVFPTTLQAGGQGFAGWFFRDPRHLLPGIWHFTIKQGARVLLEEEFHVETSCGKPIA